MPRDITVGYGAGTNLVTHAKPPSLADDAEPCDKNYVTRRVKKPYTQFHVTQIAGSFPGLVNTLNSIGS